MTCADHGEACPDLRLPRTVGQPGGGPVERFGREWYGGSWIFSDDFTPRKSWAVGAVGEVIVASALQALPATWYITHSVRLPRGRDLDHIVVGPGGLFVINSKFHGSKPVFVAGDQVSVGGRVVSHVVQGRREAELVGRALSQAYARPVVANSLIAIVADEFRELAPQTAKRVRVRSLRTVVPQLTAGAQTWPRCTVQALTALVRSPGTWTCQRDW